MTDLTAHPASRRFYFTTAGDDNNTGASINVALASPNQALSHALALVPPPTVGLAGSQAQIINDGGGSFNDVLLDNLDVIIFIGENSSLFGAVGNAYVVSLGSTTNFAVSSIFAFEPGGGVVVAKDVSQTAIDYRFITALGGAGVAIEPVLIEVTGINGDVFTNGGQLAVPAGYTGLIDDSTGGDIAIHNSNLISLEGNNSTGLRLGSVGGYKQLRFSTIEARNGVTATTGIKCSGGEIVAAGNQIIADIAIDVPSGSELTCAIADVDGDLVVDGVLNCEIIKHTGNISGTGIINGQISGINYGYYQTGSEFVATFNTKSIISLNWQELGFLPIDTTTDTIDLINAGYRQSNASSRTFDFRIIDADTSTVYFEGSNTDTGDGFKTYDVSTTPVNPLPVASPVTLRLQFKRTGSSGINDPSAVIYLTRT